MKIAILGAAALLVGIAMPAQAYPCVAGSLENGCGSTDGGDSRIVTNHRQYKWSYEIWRAPDQRTYYVRVWETQNRFSEHTPTDRFSSKTEAEQFFYKNYGRE